MKHKVKLIAAIAGAALAAVPSSAAAQQQSPVVVDLSGDPIVVGPVSIDNPLQDDAELAPTLELPGVVTGDLVLLGSSSARIGGTVDPNGSATAFRIEYGTNGVLNMTTPSVDVGAGTEPTEVVGDLLNLQPGSSYSYRIVAESPEGSQEGETRTFQTPPSTSVNPSTGEPAAAGSQKGVECTIAGTDGKDKLKGTGGDDVICGLGGNDSISGGGGNDVIYAGPGNDRVKAGAGNDRVYGNTGNDVISGGSGRDRLVAQAGRDRVYGDSGNDTIVTSKDHKRGDRVDGGKGRDSATVNRGDRTRRVERTRRK
jgi:Ca2+-binding RTX toxin-like protein